MGPVKVSNINLLLLHLSTFDIFLAIESEVIAVRKFAFQQLIKPASPVTCYKYTGV